MGKIYKGSFVNTQVDYSDNSPNEQTIYITITDTVTAEPLPYYLQFYSDPSIGGGNQLMNVSWIGLPIDTTSLIIGYSPAGEGTYTDNTITSPLPSSFYQWTVATGNYDIRIQVVRSAGPTETYYIEFNEVILETADAPVVFQTVDNSEDKFTTIKSKSCRLRVFTNDDVNAMTFASGGDQQFRVQIAVGSDDLIVFTGWLSISDLGQTFQPDPNVLELIATDGLGFLRDIPLTDEDGRSLTGPHQLVKYFSWCLQKTGLQLPIWVEMNLLEQSATYDDAADHFYNMLYLNALTFETSIGESENCFSVLEKILKEFCDISQQNNVWFIRSTDESQYATKRVCKFDYTGEVIGYDSPLLVKDIGADYDMAFMNDDARLSLQRPYKAVKHQFDFNYPTEIVQNIGFERGEVVTAPNMGAANSTGVYRPEGWTFARVGDGTSGIWYDLYQQAGARGELVKEFEYGYEKAKYFVVEHEDVAGTDYMHYLKSTPFYVKKGDRLQISVDVGQDVNLNIINPVHVWLEADTEYYTWQYDNTAAPSIINQWVSKPKPLTSSSSSNPFTQMWRITMDNALDPEDELPKYTNASSEIDIPADGKIWIRLAINFNIFTPIYFNNLRIDLIPRINGSYADLKGQQHTSEQEVDNTAVREQTVYVSDAPRVEMKGGLLLTTLGDTLFSGSAIFSEGYSVNLAGFVTPLFNINDYILISNTSLNNGKYRIVNVEYTLIPDKTVLTFAEPTVSESAGSALLQGYDYDLAGSYYNSLVYPDGYPTITYATVNAYTIDITIGPEVITDYTYNVAFDYYLNFSTGPMDYKDISYSVVTGTTTADQVVNALILLLNGNNITATNLGGGVMRVTVDSGDDRLIENVVLSVEYTGDGQAVLVPYGQHQNQAVWNQYNRVFTAFEATVDGLDTDKTYDSLPDLPDLWHLYRQKDTHPATTNKGFKLLHYEQDTDNCEWGLYMIEVYDSTIPKSYTGHSFKYIQE